MVFQSMKCILFPSFRDVYDAICQHKTILYAEVIVKLHSNIDDKFKIKFKIKNFLYLKPLTNRRMIAFQALVIVE